MPRALTDGRKWLGLVAWLGVTFLAAFIGSRFMPGEWYAGLDKPAWTPPGAVFGPVWTALYVMMGSAAWLVWRDAGFTAGRAALSAYLVQLALNATWSWLFFGLRRVDLALLDIVVLWAMIAVTIVLFRRRNTVAGMLLVPYLLWVSYATALNAAIYRLNS